KGLPYIVMSYVAGHSLQDRLEQSGVMGPLEIVRVGMQIASGLAAAHAQGLVHRDIKPSNILLEDSVERVKITDFGLARPADDASLTQLGHVLGTPQYMSPEQAQGEPTDHRADLFSLGCVLYAMAAGRSPFRAATTLAVLRRVCEDRPRPLRDLDPDVPDWLERIVMKLLAKEPADRFRSADEVAGLLGRCLAHLQQPKQNPLPHLPKPLGGGRGGGRRILLAMAMAGALAAVGILFIRARMCGWTFAVAAADPGADVRDPLIVRRPLRKVWLGMRRQHPAATRGDAGALDPSDPALPKTPTFIREFKGNVGPVCGVAFLPNSWAAMTA